MANIRLGLRVAIPSNNAKNRDKLVLGYVLHDKGANYVVQLDNGNVRTVPSNQAFAVKYYLNSKKMFTKESLDVVNTTNPEDVFKHKKNDKCGRAIIEAMLLYARKAVFKDQLREINLKVSKNRLDSRQGRKTAMGLTKYENKSKPALLAITQALNSPYEVFGTMCHELCHVAQFYLDYEKDGNTYVLNEENGMHGRTFYKWGNLVKSTVGMDVQQFHYDDDSVTFTPSKSKKRVKWSVVIATGKKEIGREYKDVALGTKVVDVESDAIRDVMAAMHSSLVRGWHNLSMFSFETDDSRLLDMLVESKADRAGLRKLVANPVPVAMAKEFEVKYGKKKKRPLPSE